MLKIDFENQILALFDVYFWPFNKSHEKNQYHFCDQRNHSFNLKCFYQILLTWWKTYIGETTQQANHAFWITSQDESHRIAGHKKDGRWKKRYITEEIYQLGKQQNLGSQDNNYMPGYKGKNHFTNTIFRPKRMTRCWWWDIVQLIRNGNFWFSKLLYVHCIIT